MKIVEPRAFLCVLGVFLIGCGGQVLDGTPITLTIDNSCTAIQQEAVEDAVDWYNDGVGQDILIIGGDGVPIKCVDFVVCETGDPNFLGCYYGDGYIEIENTLSDNRRWSFKVVRHEIGHLLGFGHSGDPNCIMFHAIGADDDCGILEQLADEYWEVE